MVGFVLMLKKQKFVPELLGRREIGLPLAGAKKMNFKIAEIFDSGAIF